LASVNAEDLASDLFGKVGTEKERGVGDVLGGRDAAQNRFFDGSFLDFGGKISGHLRANHAGCNDIDPCSKSAKLTRSGFGETDEAGFAGSVVALAEFSSLTVNGGEKDGGATVLRAEVGSEVFEQVESRVKVDSEDLRPILGGELPQDSVTGDACAVDKERWGVESFGAFLDHGLHGRRLG
jgi:hypothetical protein